MTIFFRYLGYRMKDSALRTIVISAISFFYATTFVDNIIYLYGDNQYVRFYTAFLTFYLIVLVFTIPILELSRFKNRRNLDTLYFFPLSRTKLALVHFISGFLQFIIAFTFAFSVIALRIFQTPLLHSIFIIPFYFAILLACFMVYTVICYLFSTENIVFDGVSTVLLWTLTPLLPFLFLETIGISIEPENFYLHLLYAPICFVNQIFANLFQSGFDNTDRILSYITGDWYMILLWVLLAGPVFFLYLRVFQKKGAEQAGTPSTSPVGLQFLIPAWGYIGVFAILDSLSAISIFMIMLSIFVGYFVLRKSFKLKPKDFACIGIIILAAILSLVIRPYVRNLLEKPQSENPPISQVQMVDSEFELP